MEILLRNGIIQHSAIFETGKDTAVGHALVTGAWDTVKALLRVKTLDPKTKYAIIGWIAVNAPDQLPQIVDQVAENPPNYPTLNKPY